MRMNVAARLEHRFTSRWNAGADYSRPIEYVAGLVQPLLSDALRLTAAGMLPRRIELSATGGLASGTVGLTNTERYKSYTAVVRIARALAPAVQLAIDVHAAAYEFNDAIPGAILPATFARRGIRAGVVWAPGTGARNGGVRGARP